jgi:integrase
MTTRRHFGSVSRLPSGRYQASYWHEGRRHIGRDSFNTKADALAWLSLTEADIKRREWTDPNAGKTTLSDWMAWWLDTVVDGRVDSDLTRQNYEQAIRLHITPTLGPIPLLDLTAEMVDGLLAAKAAAGLSKTYVGRMRSSLIDALDHAQRRGKLRHNVARLSIMPKCKEKTERQPSTSEEARAFLGAARGERLEALFVVAFDNGLRPGEMIGPVWPDFDLDATPPTLTMTGSMKRKPKPGGGYRMVRGPVKKSTNPNRTIELSRAAVVAVKAHRKRQAAERLVGGENWHDHGLVFCSETGTPIDASNLRRVFERIAKRAALTNVFPYLARHTTASVLLDSGATVEDVADLFGDNARTIYLHCRHKVQPVATAGTRMAQLLADEAASRT